MAINIVPKDLLELYLEMGESLNSYKHSYRENFLSFFSPIVSFGNITEARVITVGINPSYREFCEQDGSELPINRRRFIHSEAGRYDRSQLESQFSYFDVKPYKLWFCPVDDLLMAAGASYFSRNGGFVKAAHTDIRSPFPSKPAWGDLAKESPKVLMANLEKEGLFWWYRIMQFAASARLVFLFCKCEQLMRQLESTVLKRYGEGNKIFYESKLSLPGRELALIHTTDYQGVTPGKATVDQRDSMKKAFSSLRELVRDG